MGGGGRRRKRYGGRTRRAGGERERGRGERGEREITRARTQKLYKDGSLCSVKTCLTTSLC